MLISSKYLAILDRRSPELKTPTIELTIGARNDGEPLSLAQSYARLLGHLERDLSSRLGEPVAFNLKLFKIGVDSPRLLAQRRADDAHERTYWRDYMRAYEDTIRHTSAPHAPWYVVPADRKWYRNWALTRLLIEQLEALDLSWPEPDFDIEEQRRRVLA